MQISPDANVIRLQWKKQMLSLYAPTPRSPNTTHFSTRYQNPPFSSTHMRHWSAEREKCNHERRDDIIFVPHKRGSQREYSGLFTYSATQAHL